MGDILSQFGSGSSQPQASSNTNGGKLTSKDVNNYSPPQGPKNIMDPQGPGLHGVNNGCSGSQGGGEKLQRGGSVGLGGVNNGNCG